MALSQLDQSSFYRAVGYQCKLSTTNHPDAAKYWGQECIIVAVKSMRGSEPMLVVQFADGMQITGLFFSELEDKAERPLQRHKFEKTTLTGVPLFAMPKQPICF